MDISNSRYGTYLLLATNPSSGGTGYTALAKYIEGSILVSKVRRDQDTVSERVLNRIANCGAASRWYRWSSLVAEMKALSILRRREGGLAHVLWAERDWGYIDIATRYLRIPCCATFHTSVPTLREVFRSPQRLRHLSGIILMSETQREFFEKHHIAEDRIHVIPHGVDCEFFHPPSCPRDSDSFVVLSVGNYGRDFRLLRQVCMLLAGANIKIRVIAPAERNIFHDMAHVEFRSNVPVEELRSAYQEASCLLITLCEATANNAVLEGLACGVPIVTTRVGGVEEYATNGSAIFCGAGRPEEYAEAIQWLRSNSGAVLAMRTKARERAEELSWVSVAKQTVSVYETLVPTSFSRQRT